MATAFKNAATARAPLDFVHPDDRPDLYAVRCVGDCLAPVINDGSVLAFQKSATPEVSDVVGLIFTPEHAQRVGMSGMVKRLAMALPPWDLTRPPNVVGLIVVEMLNPPRTLTFRSTDVLAVHKCVGHAVPGADGMAQFKPGQTPPRIEREG